MANDLTRYRDGLFALGEVKATRRELARLELRAKGQLTGIELEADLQAARVQSVAYVGKQAMQATAVISELEGQLAEMVPDAEGRLKGIGDITALGLAEVVAATVRKVCR